MDRMLAGMLWVIVATAARGAEVGWKTPFSGYSTAPLETSGAVRIDAPPETSPFFAAGDELWDLKKVGPEGPRPTLEWLVWDATARCLVAKGEWAEIYRMHHLMGTPSYPTVCRVTVDAFETPADGSWPADDAVPVASVGSLSRSGLKSTAQWSGGGNSLEMEAETSFAESSSHAELRFSCVAEFCGQPRLILNTAVSLDSGKPLWLARDYDGKRGIDLRAKAVLELLDGSPATERMMAREGEKLVSMNPPPRDFGPLKTASDWISVFPLSTNEYFGSQSEIAPDPFAEPLPGPLKVWDIGKSVKPPESLAPWVRHDILDARKFISNAYPDFSTTDSFAGYDPISELIYLSTANEEMAENFAMLFEPSCVLPQPAILSVTLEGAGQHKLLAKSTQKASLLRLTGKDTEVRSLEIEPILGVDGQLMEVRLFFQEGSGCSPAISVNSSATLIRGQPTEVYSGGGNGAETKLRMTADVIRSFGK